MGNWDGWLNSPNCSVQETFYPLSGFGQGHFLDGYNDLSGVHSFLHMNFSKQLFEAVTLCPPAASIISKLASAYANGKQEVLNRSTENFVRGANKEYFYNLDAYIVYSNSIFRICPAGCLLDMNPIIDDFREIKHLHQLQNLFFALTGEELNVQL